MRTAYFTHGSFSDHDTGTGHPECPQRVEVLDMALRKQGLLNLLLTPQVVPCDEEHLELCHDRALIDRIKELEARGGGAIDPDTRVGHTSFRVAKNAVGAAIHAVEGVLSKRWDTAFVASRPPGHHATPSRAMGFCLFNNIAIAARHAQRKHGIKRVAILDWDVHHGNGTQDIFYEDPDVFYASVHQAPLFPHTGMAEETGTGAGLGTTLNIPLRAGTGDAGYMEAWGQVGDAVRKFEPELILVSAGYDAHYDDPLGGMEVTREGFMAMTQSTLDWARALCNGRLAFVLEGGYSMGGLSQSASGTLEVLQKPVGDMILLFDDNFMTARRIVVQAEAAGKRIEGLKEFPSYSLQETPQIVLINLNARVFSDTDYLISRCRHRFPGARIIGFSGHLEVALRQKAKAAGIDKLLTNEQALKNLAEYL